MLPPSFVDFRDNARQLLLLITFSGLLFSSTSQAICPPGTGQKLGHLLSTQSSVKISSTSNSRWSLYGAPNPSLYVQIGEENDVAVVVNFANKHKYPFLLQNGGNGWADTFDLNGCGILIDISGLRQVTFDKNKTKATIQGGVTVKGLVDAGYDNDSRFANPTCNCLGFLGASLGGGLTRSAGLYGWSVDQLVSANVVLASGKTVQVNASSDPDLWWALRGAAPNFGIVTSAVIKVYPISAERNTAWQGVLTFSDDKVKQLMQAINDLELDKHPRMQIDFLFSTSGAPSYKPTISVIAFYVGSSSAAESAFASILKLKPTSYSASQLPYDQWNAFGDSFCAKGDRKAAYSASLKQIDASTWSKVYREYKSFIASNPEAFGNTSILAENYPVNKAQAIGSATSSFPFRSLSHHVIAIAWYNDPKLDAQANAWGAKIRSMWWATAGTAQNSSYINFAHGDEPLSAIYGTSLPRLQRLKAIYDPNNRFNQWFPLAAKVPHY